MSYYCTQPRKKIYPWLVNNSEGLKSHGHRPTLSPWFALPQRRKALVEWRRQTQSPSVGAASEEQQHFKWNVRFSRHIVIHFSSATGFEAGEGAGQPGCNWRLLTTNQGFQRQKVDGGRALEMRNNKNLLFTIDEQRAVKKKVSV